MSAFFIELLNPNIEYSKDLMTELAPMVRSDNWKIK